MTHTAFTRGAILFFRISIGWTFLYAGATQVTDPNFTVAAFLGATKTFHAFFEWFASPAMAPFTNVLVPWGHLLIGLSMVSGLLVSVSGVFGILLMITYYFAHMDFPYVEGNVNFIMDYHLVYAAAIALVIAARGGEVLGLDGWIKARRASHIQPKLAPQLS